MSRERTDIKQIMWRKKVDNSLLGQRKETTIPIPYVDKWELDKHFDFLKEKRYDIPIEFQKITYEGYIRKSKIAKRKNPVHKLFIPNDLQNHLKKVFLMSHIRYLEFLIRNNKKTEQSRLMEKIESETPFWEFVDIEFFPLDKKFLFVAHFTQEPSFPELFKNMVESPKLKQIEDSLFGRSDHKIHKQSWKNRSELNTELGANNVVYTLLDTKNKLIYVGQTQQDLIVRLNDKEFYKQIIPYWTHYRYDALPQSVDRKGREAIEKMLINSYATILKNNINVNTLKISEYKLVNRI